MKIKNRITAAVCLVVFCMTFWGIVPVSAEPANEWRMDSFSVEDAEAAYQGQYCMVDTDGDNNLRFTFKAKADEPMDTGIWAHAPLGVDKVEPKNYYDIEFRVKVENPADNFLLGALGLTAEGGQNGTFHHYVSADGKLSACVSASEWVSQYGGKISIGEFSKIRYVVDKKNGSVEVWVNDIKQGMFYANQVSNAWDTISSYLNFGTQPPKKLNGDTVVTIDYIRVKSSDTKPEDPEPEKPRVWEKTSFTAEDGSAAYQNQYTFVETDEENNLKFRFKADQSSTISDDLWARANIGIDEIAPGDYYTIEFRVKTENPQDTMLYGTFGSQAEGGAATFHHYMNSDGSLAACKTKEQWTSNYGKIENPEEFVTIQYLVDMKNSTVDISIDGSKQGTYYLYQVSTPLVSISDYLSFGGKKPQQINGDYSVTIDSIRLESMDQKPLPHTWEKTDFTTEDGDAAYKWQYAFVETDAENNLVFRFKADQGQSTGIWGRAFTGINEVAAERYYEIEYRAKADNPPDNLLFGSLSLTTTSGASTFHHYMNSDGSLAACKQAGSWTEKYGGTIAPGSFGTVRYVVDTQTGTVDIWINQVAMGTFYMYQNTSAITNFTNYLTFGEKGPNSLSSDYSITIDYVKIASSAEKPADPQPPEGEASVDSFYLCDAQGIKLLDLEGQQNVGVRAVVTNNSWEEYPLTAVIALYSDSGALVQTALESAKVPAGAGTVRVFDALACDVSGAKKGWYAKAMLWQGGLESMKPAVQADTAGFGAGAKLADFAGLKEKENINVVYLGGSITEGAASTDAQNKSWAGMTSKLFTEAFPASNVQNFNAGVGGTGSDYGLLRLYDDVAVKEPDVVFVEFAVNDRYASPGKVKQQMEGIVRNLLSLPKTPYIIFVYTASRQFDACAQVHQQIADYYGIPSIDLQSMVQERCLTGEISFSDYWEDDVHPNDKGHALYAALVENCLNQPEKYLKLPVSQENPLMQNYYPYMGQRILPEKAEKTGTWTAEGTSLYSDERGAKLTLSFEGPIFAFEARLGTQYGKIKVSIDGEQKAILDQYYTGIDSQKVLPFSTFELTDGPHTAVIEVLGEKNDAASGYRVQIDGLITKKS